MPNRILWIEEEVESKLSNYKAYLMFCGYQLSILTTATEAEIQLANQNAFDLILLDLRINPGNDQKWKDRFNHANYKKLGNYLLEEAIKTNNYLEKVLIFSYEYYDKSQSAQYLGITESRFLKKSDTSTPEELVEFIVGHFPLLKIEIPNL